MRRMGSRRAARAGQAGHRAIVWPAPSAGLRCAWRRLDQQARAAPRRTAPPNRAGARRRLGTDGLTEIARSRTVSPQLLQDAGDSRRAARAWLRWTASGPECKARSIARRSAGGTGDDVAASSTVSHVVGPSVPGEPRIQSVRVSSGTRRLRRQRPANGRSGRSGSAGRGTVWRGHD